MIERYREKSERAIEGERERERERVRERERDREREIEGASAFKVSIKAFIHYEIEQVKHIYPRAIPSERCSGMGFISALSILL